MSELSQTAEAKDMELVTTRTMWLKYPGMAAFFNLK